MPSCIVTQMTIDIVGSVRTADDLSGHETRELVLIARQHTSAEILLALARHDNSVVRAAVAGNPNITQEIRDLLASSDPEGAVKAALGRNTVASAVAIGDTIGKVRDDIQGGT